MEGTKDINNQTGKKPDPQIKTILFKECFI